MATHADITRAYRKAMKQAHPDRQPAGRRAEAEAYARRLNAAYAVLSDPLQRVAYDRTIRQQVIQDQIMRRYVGGFDGFGVSGQPVTRPRHEPTEAERRERLQADRKAWTLLVMVAAGITLAIIAGVVFGSFFGSLLQAVF